MTERNLKALTVLLIFFLLDTVKPFTYSLITEFTFLGVVLICLNYPLKTSLFFAAIFGYFKDAICNDTANLNLLEFSAVAVLIHYCLRNFHGKAAKILIFFGALTVHIVVNNFYISKATYLFSLLFFIHSSVIFLLINRLFGQWLYGELKGNNVI
jgi:cell shape-determining protein MreD